jgi:hypothetical protein
MLVARQVGDKQRYAHVNQVPVEKHAIFSCPERVRTLPTRFIDYVLNAFDPAGTYAHGWPEVGDPRPSSEWRRPARVLLLGDAEFECPGARCPPDPKSGAACEHTLRKCRLNHPAAMLLKDLNKFDINRHASLDRMDVFQPSQIQTYRDRRAGTVTHQRSFCNWLHADYHSEPVRWLKGKRTEREWLRMYGVKKP